MKTYREFADLNEGIPDNKQRKEIIAASNELATALWKYRDHLEDAASSDKALMRELKKVEKDLTNFVIKAEEKLKQFFEDSSLDLDNLSDTDIEDLLMKNMKNVWGAYDSKRVGKNTYTVDVDRDQTGDEVDTIKVQFKNVGGKIKVVQQ